MTDTNRAASNVQWTSVQAYTLAVICLLAGIAGGWLIRGSQSPAVVSQETPGASGAGMQSSGAQTPTPAQMKHMADTQAGPLLERLKSDPSNAELLANIGNLYYDARQYAIAIQYYEKSLDLQPTQSGVRTDMGTAYWYTGDADTAIAEFNKSLAYESENPNTLFNLGIVKWQGKQDPKGALAAWQKLLDKHPDYENKAQVQQYMEQAREHPNEKPGATAKPLSE